MARLEVRWITDSQPELAAELTSLGLDEVEPGFFVAEGEGRVLIKTLGAVRDLEKARSHVSANETIVVNFQDPRSAVQ